MTGTYNWNPMPHVVDVRCPACQGKAKFEFAEVVRIVRVEEVPFFQNSKQFNYQRLQDGCGHYWHAAFYFAGLHGAPSKALHDLPVGYQAEQWAHSKYWTRNHGTDLGSISCSQCGLHRQHQLDWPNDAFYSIAYKHQVLWAFDRDFATELHHYLRSDMRNPSQFRWRNFLLHVPSIFKSHKAREVVCKQLGMLLNEVHDEVTARLRTRRGKC